MKSSDESTSGGTTVAAIGERTPVIDSILAAARESGIATVALDRQLKDVTGNSGASAKLLYGRNTRRVIFTKFRHSRIPYEPDGYLLNCARRDGTTVPQEVAQKVRDLRKKSKRARIIVVLDERNGEAVNAARNAGASMYFGTHETLNAATVSWRLNSALSTPANEAEPADEADVALQEAVRQLPAPGEHRRKLAEQWTRIDAPALRDPDTGRLDAKRIAERLQISQAQIARALGMVQQTISATPSGKRLQAGLAPIARLLATLDELMEPEQQRMWLHTPRADLEGQTPLQYIEMGRAASVAGKLEGVFEGILD